MREFKLTSITATSSPYISSLAKNDASVLQELFTSCKNSCGIINKRNGNCCKFELSHHSYSLIFLNKNVTYEKIDHDKFFGCYAVCMQ